MSYTDEEDEAPPTVADRVLDALGAGLDTIEREKSFILDLILLVIVAASLATSAIQTVAVLGFAALFTHVVLTYRGRR